MKYHRTYSSFAEAMAAQMAQKAHPAGSAREALTPPKMPTAGDVLLAKAIEQITVAKTALSGNPFAPSSWDVSAQMRIVREDPAKAAKLQAEAGAVQAKSIAHKPERPTGIASLRARNPVHAKFMKNNKD